MGKNIVVEGCQLIFQNGGLPTAISITPGQLSNKVKCDGRKAYKTLNFTINGYLGGSITDGNGTGSGSINASSTKLKIEGNKAILEGDMSSTVTITGTNSTSGVPVTVTFPEIVKVQSAGQMKVKAI